MKHSVHKRKAVVTVKRCDSHTEALEVVEEVAPTVEDSGLVLVLVQLIVDVPEHHRLGKVARFYTAYTVLPHPLKWYAVLG